VRHGGQFFHKYKPTKNIPVKYRNMIV